MALWSRRVTGDNQETRAVSFTDAAGVEVPSPIAGFAGHRGAAADMQRLGAETYKASATFQRAENLIVENLATRPLQVLGPDGSPVDHPLLKVWNQKPNAFQSAYAFHEARLRRKERYGQYHLILDRGVNGLGPVRSMTLVTTPVRMLLTPPSASSPDGDLVGWQVLIGQQWVNYRPSEVLWDRYIDPDDPWGARSPITAILSSVGMAEAARKWQATMLENGATPNVIVVMQGATREQVRAASGSFHDTWGRPGVGQKAGFLGGAVGNDGKPLGVDIHQVSWNNDQVGWLDTLKISQEEIAQAAGIPIDLISGNRNSYENLDASETLLWSSTLMGKLRSSASEIDRLLLPETELTASFDTADVDALKENINALVDRWTKILEANGCTVNEYREQIGLEPHPKGNVFLAEFQAALNLSNAQALAASGAVGQVTRDAITVTGVRNDPQTPQIAATRAAEGRSTSTGVITPAEKIRRSYDDFEADGIYVVRQLADAMSKHVERNLKAQAKRAKPGVPEVRVDLGQVFNTEAMVERAREILGPWLMASWRASARMTAKGLDIPYDQHVSQAIIDAVSERSREAGRLIVGTTADELSQALADGVADKESIDDIAARLQAVFVTLSDTRAETIARTEVVGGHNAAARQVAIQSGIQGLRRRWMATPGNRTRASHHAQDGYVTEGLYDRYPNGLMHPGDAGAPAHEVVNCRCVEEYLAPGDE